jgi:TetR/AcrR family transcriptional repressor of lmrAB and yxaGH operons
VSGLPVKRRQKRQSENHPTRERLIRAGVLLFQSSGYHGTGVNEILERAKAPKGSFYYHFPGGKEELAVAALGWLQHEVTRYLDELSAAGAASTAMVQGIARHAAEGIRKGGRTRRSLIAVLAQDIASDSPLVAIAIKEFASAIRCRIAKAYAEDSPEDDAFAFADQAMAMIEGASVLAQVAGKADLAVDVVSLWLRESIKNR